MGPMDHSPGDGPIRLGVVALALEAARVSEHASGADTVAAAGRPISLVAQVRTVADALGLIEGPAALDVLLCDLQVEHGIDGLKLIEAAARRGIRAIAFTSHDRASMMRAVFEAGGVGFLPKTTEVADVFAAIRTVAAGGTAFSTQALEAVRQAPRPPSDRERAVLDGIASGMTSDEIGLRLEISGRTVESHLRRLFDRYGVVSRTELVVLASSEGWIFPEIR
jgi:DNA-binding NarL/FixJ family response regulator